MQLSILAGYTPRLDACISCDQDPNGSLDEVSPYFAPSLGGVLCAGCRMAASDAFPLPPETLFALRTLITRPIKEAAVEGRLEGSVRRVVSAHVLTHAPGSTVLVAPEGRTLRPA